MTSNLRNTNSHIWLSKSRQHFILHTKKKPMIEINGFLSLAGGAKDTRSQTA